MLIEHGTQQSIFLRMLAPLLWPLAVLTFSVVVVAESRLDGSIIWFTPKKIAMLLIWAWAISAAYRPDVVFQWGWKVFPIKLHPNCADEFQQGLEKIRRFVGKNIKKPAEQAKPSSAHKGRKATRASR